MRRFNKSVDRPIILLGLGQKQISCRFSR